MNSKPPNLYNQIKECVVSVLLLCPHYSTLEIRTTTIDRIAHNTHLNTPRKNIYNHPVDKKYITINRRVQWKTIFVAKQQQGYNN